MCHCHSLPYAILAIFQFSEFVVIYLLGLFFSVDIIYLLNINRRT